MHGEKSNSSKLLRLKQLFLKGARFRLGLPFFPIEFYLGDLLEQPSVDERIKKLYTIKDDLEKAMEAVDEMTNEAITKQGELQRIRTDIEELSKDKSTLVNVLMQEESSLFRIIKKATSRGQWVGIIEGLIIGIITGCISSYLIWYITQKPTK